MVPPAILIDIIHVMATLTIVLATGFQAAILLSDIVPDASYSPSYSSGRIVQLPNVSDTQSRANNVTLANILVACCSLTYSSGYTCKLPTVDSGRAVVCTLRTAYAGCDMCER